MLIKQEESFRAYYSVHLCHSLTVLCKHPSCFSFFFFFKFESEYKHGLKISDKLQTGNQITLSMIENTVFFRTLTLYWNKRISCFYFCMTINLSPTEKLEPYSSPFFPAGFIASPCFLHITHSLSVTLSIWTLSFRHSVILPAKELCF